MTTLIRDRFLARAPGWQGWVGLGGRWLLVVTFLYAGGIKLAAPGELAEAIANYQILPPLLTPWAAAVVPGIEVMAALALAAALWSRAAASVILALMVGFTAAVVSALVRGLNIECGCFGSEAALDWTTLVRDLVLLLVAVVVVRWPPRAQNGLAPKVSFGRRTNT